MPTATASRSESRDARRERRVSPAKTRRPRAASTSRIGPGSISEPYAILTGHTLAAGGGPRETWADEISGLRVGDHVEFPGDVDRPGVWRVVSVGKPRPSNGLAEGAVKLGLDSVDREDFASIVVPRRPLPVSAPVEPPPELKPEPTGVGLFDAGTGHRDAPPQPRGMRFFESAVCGGCESIIPPEQIFLSARQPQGVTVRLADCRHCDSAYRVADACGYRDIGPATDPADLAEIAARRDAMARVRRYEPGTDARARELAAAAAQGNPPLTGDPFDGM